MKIVITSDVDFVSDAVIKAVYKDLVGIPMTIFQTHPSKALDQMFAENKCWEAEIHPNFCTGSTQGNTVEEIISNLESLNSAKLGYRCHKYYTVNDVEEYYQLKGYKYISNVCTDVELVEPFTMRNGMIQFPIFMEDGGYLKYHGVPTIDIITQKMKRNGIYVFNFHPIHLALNSNDFSYIRKIKNTLSTEEYQNMNIDLINKCKNNGYGIHSFLLDLLNYAKDENIELCTLEECYREREDNSF